MTLYQDGWCQGIGIIIFPPSTIASCPLSGTLTVWPLSLASLGSKAVPSCFFIAHVCESRQRLISGVLEEGTWQAFHFCSWKKIRVRQITTSFHSGLWHSVVWGLAQYLLDNNERCQEVLIYCAQNLLIFLYAFHLSILTELSSPRHQSIRPSC